MNTTAAVSAPTPAARPMRRMNFFFWWDQFKPTGNPSIKGGPSVGDECRMFETFGADLATVQEQARKDITKVWTLLDCDGFQVISPGMHFVNRMGYYITERPWLNELRDVKVG